MYEVIREDTTAHKCIVTEKCGSVNKMLHFFENAGIYYPVTQKNEEGIPCLKPMLSVWIWTI